MNSSNNQSSKRPKYPPFWEKFVPIAVGIIVFATVILLIIAITVALGLFPN